jgi:PEGA domain
VARSGPSHPSGGGRVSGGPSRGGGPYRGGSASSRSPYYRGGSNGQGYRPSYGYGRPGYGYSRYGYGHSYYRSYGHYGYYRPYGYYGYYRPYYGYYGGYYGWPYYGFGFGIGYPYWGAYAWGYPYYAGGYWGGYYGGHSDASDYQGAARLEVKPRTTEVFVDGYYAGVVDDFDGFSQRLRLEPGEHEVTLFLEGYRPLTRRMLFTVGQTVKVEHEMEPLGAGEPPPQRPVPTAKPPAPARTRYGQPGMQRQVSGHPGDPVDTDRDVDVTVIEPPESRARTERPVPPDEVPGPSGTLSIRVQPDDAEVVIDGEPWTRSGGERLIVALAPGVHRLEVRRSGHETYVGLVRIRQGVATTLNVALATVETR